MRPRGGASDDGAVVANSRGMRSRRSPPLALGLATVLLLGTPVPGAPQAARNGTAPEALGGLQVGQWAQLEGTRNGSGGPVDCTRARHLTGDFLDDDWAVRGAVTTIDAKRREFTIGACRIRVTDRTVFNHPRQTFREFAHLRPGLLIEVEGSFLAEGVLVAAEVDDETDELPRRPGLRDEVKVVGRVGRVDPRRRLITVMGIDFHVTPKTRMRSAIR